MTPDIQNQNKDRILKLLAIGGLIGLVIMIAWLGVQLVRVMPNAFTSLASLADSVYNYQPYELVVVSSAPVVNNGESVTLTWNDPEPVGSFSFMYTCADGVAIDIRTTGNGITPTTCDVPVELGDVRSVDVLLMAERNRFSDITYTISFITPRAIATVASATGTLSVVNVQIAPPENTATSTPPSVPTKPATPPTPSPTATTTIPTISVNATTTKPVTVVPVTITKPIYTIPVSNPNGNSDLAIRSLGAGILSNNQFINVGTLTNDTISAIQIEVKNIGTKTSANFTFSATLPNGSTYTSPVQNPLKPNERAVLTIGFKMSEETGVHTFNAMVTTTSDSNNANNRFTSAVRVK
jgi:hypothetical protein